MQVIIFMLAFFAPLATALAMYNIRDEHIIHLVRDAAIAVSFVGALALAFLAGTSTFLDLSFGVFSLSFGLDECGRIFVVLFSAIFLLASIFSTEYIAHSHNPRQYNLFFLLTFWAMLGLSFAQNLFTYYMCYELMTILSLPLVLFEGTADAHKAGLKYLGYSLFGASLALFGFFCLGSFCDTTTFIPSGTLNAVGMQNHSMLLFAVFCLLLGFGCKAGIMPLHFWLPTAHPVAPAPASAVLSATITKAGVLGIIRVIYYVVGVQALRGTWVQYLMLTLALMTVFSGSMLAFKERLMKRRFAWSTVSQVSYVLFGLFLMTSAGVQAAMMQVIFHAVCKTALFLTAGAIIHYTGHTYVDELDGIGHAMPAIMAGYTLASLSLIGIPPFAGFVSKWNLVTAGMQAMPRFGVVGAVVLLVSAILTAGYLLPLSINSFFKADKTNGTASPTWRMAIPILILSGALLLMGIAPHGLVSAIGTLSSLA